MAEKKLSKKALNKSFRNWAYGNLTCFSQEHMQTFGYLCAMLPLVEELYDTKEEQKEAMNTYTAFFNTEPQVGSIIVGITAGLEEEKQMEMKISMQKQSMVSVPVLWDL